MEHMEHIYSRIMILVWRLNTFEGSVDIFKDSIPGSMAEELHSEPVPLSMMEALGVLVAILRKGASLTTVILIFSTE
jgi:hypothetical protein